MSDNNFFSLLENPLGDLGNLEQEYLGPDYKYYKKIKTPSQLGMGSKGSFGQLGKDISGLVDYVEVLVTGRSKAQTKPTPLGNRFFLKTGAQCKDSDGKLQDRWMYVDNIPDGDIPILSSALDSNFTEFEGLVPGAISKMNDLNPTHFMKAFVSGSEPPCRNVTLNTVDVSDNSSFDTNYVSDYDVAYINPCNFKDRKNPVTNKVCKEGFSTIDNRLERLNKLFNINTSSPYSYSQTHKKIRLNNLLEKSYYASVSVLLFYILFKLLSRKQ